MPLLPAKWIGVGCLCNRSSQQEEVVHHPTEHHGEPADHADGGKEDWGSCSASSQWGAVHLLSL